MATRSGVRAALATVEAADAATSLTGLPVLLLPALMGAVAAESAVWTELDAFPGSPPRRVFCHPEPLLDPVCAAAVERHVPDFPLIRHTRPGGPGTPARRSDLQNTASFRGSGMYAEVAGKLGADQMLAMAMTVGGLHVCLALNRARRDFSAAEVDLLRQLRPLLTRRLGRLSAPGRPVAGQGLAPGPGRRARPGHALLTVRQQQVLGLVADGLTDAAIGRRLGCSPRTVDKHLEHAYRRLGVSCRTAAMAAAFEVLLPAAAGAGAGPRPLRLPGPCGCPALRLPGSPALRLSGCPASGCLAPRPRVPATPGCPRPGCRPSGPPASCFWPLPP